MAIWVRIFETELMIEIYSKSLVRAIGNVLILKSNLETNSIHKTDSEWPLFVNKQLFWWSPSITLDNNNAVLTDLTSCISIVFFSFGYFLPFDHYAACLDTLIFIIRYNKQIQKSHYTQESSL